MKLNNTEIINIYNTLQGTSNNLTDMNLRWKLALYCEPLSAVIDLIQNEIERLINNEGETNDDGKKLIDTTNNIHYKEILLANNDIDIAKLSTSDLATIGIMDLRDMILLKKIISEDAKGVF